MTTLLKFFAKLIPATVTPSHDRYLASSVDIYDLERRMRLIDSGRHPLHSIGAAGISGR